MQIQEKTHSHRSNMFQFNSENPSIIMDRWQKYENYKLLILCSLRATFTLKLFSTRYCRRTRKISTLAMSMMADYKVMSGRLLLLVLLLNYIPHILFYQLMFTICFKQYQTFIFLLLTYYTCICLSFSMSFNHALLNIIITPYKIYVKGTQMGNQQSKNYERRSRYRTLQNKNKSKINSSRRYGESVDDDHIFVTPPINRSVAQLNQQDNDEDKQVQPKNKYKANNLDTNIYRSIDVNQSRNGSRAKKKSDNDRILDQLSRKNQQLRKQLKQISDELTEKLKRKKLIPKKKKKNEDEESEYQNEKQANQKQLIGLKRELENGYKQIQMYKKTIANLKSKEEGITADHRVNVLENDLLIKDQEIEKCMKKVEAMKKIKGKQDFHIEKDINDDLKDGIDTYKRELQQLKIKLKQYANKDRTRQVNYKKQQAYLCDLQKKMREVDGTYFPYLSNNLKKQEQKATTISDKNSEVNQKQFYHVLEQARLLRIKHQQYNRKIQVLLQTRNKRIQEQNDLKDQVLYKQRIIEALKIKIATLQKLLKPRRTNLFGEGGSQAGSEMQSQYNDNQSQLERQLQQELNQDQFDIKHLLSNIPKPVRKKPQEISNGYSSGGSSEGERRRRAGLLITSEKAQPKKWGVVSIRTQQRGKHFKGQLAFEDRAQFEGDVQPIIVGVNVWVNKNNTVLGIQAIYLNQNQLRYGVKSSDSADGIIRRFDLQSPDYLKNLTLTFGKEGFVESITLYSKQGKVGKFGNKRAEDENINFGLASSQRPFMFLGASSLYQAQPRLNFFGMQICSQ